MTALRTMSFIFALLCIWGGVQSAGKLFDALTPKSRFLVVQGQVLEVRSHIESNPGLGGRLGADVKIYEVLFNYVMTGKELTMNTFSPLCTFCRSEDIVSATGMKPSQLAKGQSVNVFVDRNDASRAFLLLPSITALLIQGLLVMVSLFIAPAFAWFFCFVWERNNDA